jgi:dienelactone hydrolase
VLWLHGRTVSKELDPGRYLRWIRAGIAACAMDLPGHGERLDPAWHDPSRTLDLIAAAVPEIDAVLAALAQPPHSPLFDTATAAIGGMSAGGIVALRRLADPHHFRAAAVEATIPDLAAVYHAGPAGRPAEPARIAALNPLRHVERWRPIPLLVLHTEADRVAPIAGVHRFARALRDHYQAAGADPALISLMTWPTTGAPDEHSGFGRFGNEAKNAQVDFLARALGANPPNPGI